MRCCVDESTHVDALVKKLMSQLPSSEVCRVVRTGTKRQIRVLRGKIMFG